MGLTEMARWRAIMARPNRQTNANTLFGGERCAFALNVVVMSAFMGGAIQFQTATWAQEKPSAERREKAAEKPLSNTVFFCRHEGQEVYTNTRLNKACKATVLGPQVATVAVKPGASPTSASAGPGGFPKVTEDAQRARDVDRRRILEEEMATEQKQLESAKKEFEVQSGKATQEEKNYQKIIERLQPYKEKINQHERNVQALRKELAGLPK